MKFSALLLSLTSLLATAAQADPLLLSSKGNTLSLSIYNQNIALVKDSRTTNLANGINDIIFDGVAQKIQPETALIYGDGIKVSEQNYNYNLMSYENFIKQSVGQEVNTIRQNPTTGENIYERATILGYADGQLILRFPYGIDTKFPGRIVFNQIPAGSSNKPTLEARINAVNGGNKTLNLAYLTDGINWKTDYVVHVNSPTNLDLTGWVTINNESGVDYENAKIQLIAGDVNVVRDFVRPRMMLMAAKGMNDSIANSIESVEPETLSSYELYTLPTTTSIKDHQTKQIALLEKKDVKYKREFNLTSPFYFNIHSSSDEFEKLHPAITYVLNNKAEDNLGISLPAGTIRFYEKDKSGNLQFIGSNRINNTAKEDTLRLNLGQAFNITASGKITANQRKELNQTMLPNKCFRVKFQRSYDVEITVNNAENSNNTVILSQNFPQDYKIIKENFKSVEKNHSERRWEISAVKNSKETLKYTVEITYTENRCD